MAPLRYRDDCPSLPISRPPGFPHIIDARGFSESTDIINLRFADGIATFLWNWDKDQFHRFFDLSETKFEIHYDAPDAMIKDMIISRIGPTVVAGFRIDDGYGGKEWDPQLVFEIQDDGSWKAAYCSEASNPIAIEGFGKRFSQAMMYHRPWELRKPSTKVTVYHE